MQLTGTVLKSEPDNLEALFLRGLAHFYLDDRDMAKRHFSEVSWPPASPRAARHHSQRGWAAHQPLGLLLQVYLRDHCSGVGCPTHQILQPSRWAPGGFRAA